MTAWQNGAQEQLIADAAVYDEKMLVVNCALQRFEVAFDQIQALARLPKPERPQFMIADDDSYLY